MTTQLQAARERGRRDGLILLARLRHNIQLSDLRLGRLVDCPSPLNLNSGERYNLQRGAKEAERIGVYVQADEPRPAASNLGLPLEATTGGCTSYEAQ